MRRSVRDFSRTQMVYDIAVANVVDKAMGSRYTQMPSMEMQSRRPYLDPVMVGGHPIRKARVEEGVSFCEPIQRDWEW